MAVTIPDAVKRKLRTQELLRLQHNRVGARATSATDTTGFALWRKNGYPITPLPQAMSKRQFELWRSAWFTPRSLRVAEGLAALKDAWIVAEAVERGVPVRDLDWVSTRESLKASTTFDGDIDLVTV